MTESETRLDRAMRVRLPVPSWDELAAYCYGAAVVEEADRLVRWLRALRYGSLDILDRAARHAGARAMVLDEERVCAYGVTADQKAGLRLQAKFWREVAKEISEREAQ